jgi:predicted dehydrogenase
MPHLYRPLLISSLPQFHLDCQEDQLKAGLKPGDPGFGIEPEERAGTFTAIVDGQPTGEKCPNIEPVTYSAFYTQFAQALAGKGDVPVEPEGARDLIRLIELARRSSQEGRSLRVGERYDGID